MQTLRNVVRVSLRGQARFLNTPHGGTLINKMVSDKTEALELVKQCEGRVIELTERQSCDTELIVTGGFSPLDGFMTEDDYTSVVDKMRLENGLIFGLPVVLDTFNPKFKIGHKVLLQYQGHPMAVFDIASKWKPNKVAECKKLYGTSELEHPGCLMVACERGDYYLGGELHGLTIPKRDFPCQTPAELRSSLPQDVDVVAFQCRNPVHRAHYELFTRALDAPNVGKDGVVLVHPTCGPTQADDIPGTVRYHTYEVLKEETHNPRVNWAYMPYSMHMAGPREAIQHMLLRKNYGCTHFIIGRDMAGSKSSITGEDYYGAYDAQDFAAKHGPELGMKTVPSLNLVYTDEGYVTAEAAKEKGLKPLKLSGTEFRRRLRAGEDIPEWFAFKSVVDVLRQHTMTSA
ncbi:Sulfate adenylyltransferase [Diplonema papillatum]|nr:Sulfate adenylyltransferase [Diplonema papillatum]|eukprot:gene21179-32623_t